MFANFSSLNVDTGEAVIHLRKGARTGHASAARLPETHVMWHKVAPRLASDFAVIAANLRGYGESSKPASSDDHGPYSKRVMARDMANVMVQLGFPTLAMTHPHPLAGLRIVFRNG